MNELQKTFNIEQVSTDSAIYQIMIEADTDQNGEISLSEFNNIFKKFLEKPTTTPDGDDKKEVVFLEVVAEEEEPD